MRPIIAVVLFISLIGGVFAYSRFLEHIRPEPPSINEYSSEGQYDLELVCTFDCESDDFAQAAVKVKFRDSTLLDRKEPLPAGHAVRILDIQEIKVGSNDLFVQVNPAINLSGSSTADPFSLSTDTSSAPKNNDPFSLSDQADSVSESENGSPVSPSAIQSTSVQIARAVHIRIYRNGIPVAEKTLWSDMNGAITDLVKVEIN